MKILTAALLAFDARDTWLRLARDSFVRITPGMKNEASER